MDIHRLPNRRMYWRKHGLFKSDFVSNCFTMKFFNKITMVLHYTNTSEFSEAKRHRKNRENSFWTIENLMVSLAMSFQHYYACGKLIDIDEMCIHFKGCHHCKCYNLNKSNKWHFKACCLNDSKTGYLSNFFMYRAK